MAVLDLYTNPDLVTATYKTTAAHKGAGSKGRVDFVSTFEIAAGDDDGSVYRFLKAVPSTFIPISMRLSCDAITAGTDYDCGFYETDMGAVIDKDILADGINPSAGYSRILGLDLLVTVDLANAEKMLYELPVNGTAYTIRNRPNAFDIALTANTVGTGGGTVTIYASFLSP